MCFSSFIKTKSNSINCFLPYHSWIPVLPFFTKTNLFSSSFSLISNPNFISANHPNPIPRRLQKGMAEEHRCQAPRLCANNCGFFGSPATQNLCSKCYRDLQLKEQQSSSAKQALNQSFISSPPSSSTTSVSSPVVDLSLDKKPVSNEKGEENPVLASAAVHHTAVNRCLTCRRRVGLTGFKCRCGYVFCGSHRYPEQHDCTFDFKEMGKEQIARANPVVKAEKLQKI